MLRVTQEAIEVVRQPTATKACATQIVVEAVFVPINRKAKTSQIAIEVLRKSAAPSSDGAQQPLVIIVAG